MLFFPRAILTVIGLCGLVALRTAAQTPVNSPVGAAADPQAASGASPATLDTLRSHLGHVCVEDYLAPNMAGDYGKAINAAVQAAPLSTQTRVDVCLSGDHKLETQVVFDRPISFWMANARLILQPSLASPRETLSGAVLTAGSASVTVPSTASLRAGMAVGGIGVTSTAYIESIPSPTTFAISLPAGIQINGMTTARSAVVKGLSSTRGLAIGQGLAGLGIPADTNIAAIDYGSQSLTMSRPASSSAPLAVSALSVAPGSTWTTTLTAVAVTPAIAWTFKPGALHNSEGQMIGGEMHNVWLSDPGHRTLTGVQGVQIFGWDRFKSDHLQIENLQGSALILGGYSPSAGTNGSVRESYFYDTELRDSGDLLTGQPSLELMTSSSDGNARADEINQIGFSGLQCVFPYAEGITLGTFNRAHTGANGPRLIWFGGNTQVEGGSHLRGQNLEALADVVHILRGGDIYFDGVELAVPGYGHSVVHMEQVGTVGIMNSLLFASGRTLQYTVSLTQGSPTVTYVAGGGGGFPKKLVDGVGARIADGAACKACNVYTLPLNAVNESGNVLTLASNWNGATNARATLTFFGGGYYFTNTAGRKLTAFGGHWSDAAPEVVNLLGLPDVAATVIAGVPPASSVLDRDGLSTQALTVGSGAPVHAINFYTTGPITPAAVAANSCSDQPIPVAGVTMSDYIGQINWPGSLGNLSVAGKVSAPGKLTLHFCNPTGASVTPPKGAYTFDAHR